MWGRITRRQSDDIGPDSRATGAYNRPVMTPGHNASEERGPDPSLSFARGTRARRRVAFTVTARLPATISAMPASSCADGL